MATERVTSGITVGIFGRTLWRRAACAASLVTFWGAGYFLIANSLVMRQARDLATLPDRTLPFLGWTVWIYLAGLLFIAAPLFVLCPESTFHRAARSYALVMLASFACFVAFPVSSPSLREAAIMAEHDSLTAWTVRALHGIDPPCNLFPSLHVSLSALSYWSMAEAQPRLRWLFAAVLALIAVSVVTTKQHLLLDVLGGLALAWAVRTVPGRSTGILWVARGLFAGVSALFGLLYWCAS